MFLVLYGIVSILTFCKEERERCCEWGYIKRDCRYCIVIILFKSAEFESPYSRVQKKNKQHCIQTACRSLAIGCPSNTKHVQLPNKGGLHYQRPKEPRRTNLTCRLLRTWNLWLHFHMKTPCRLWLKRYVVS